MLDVTLGGVTLVILDLILYKSGKCEIHSYVLEVFIFLILSRNVNRYFVAVKVFVVTKRI
jgi:hypothetical protein